MVASRAVSGPFCLTHSLACFFAGMGASYQFSIPAGASVVVVNLLVFLLFMTWQALERA